MIRSLKLFLFITFGMGVTVVFVLVFQRVRTHRDAAEQSACTGNLKAIGIALQSYQQSNFGRFPPAYVYGPDGKRWHSWRVLILPYLGEYEIYRDYRFDEPWNGPSNIKLASKMPKSFFCPSSSRLGAIGFTSYFAIAGPGTAFPDDGRSFPFPWANGFGLPRVSPDDQKPLLAKDGQPLLRSSGALTHGIASRASETLLVVESTGFEACWMEPRDFELNEMCLRLNDANAASASSNHRHSIVLAAMLDSSVKPLVGLAPDDIRRMCLVDPDNDTLAPKFGKPISE